VFASQHLQDVFFVTLFISFLGPTQPPFQWALDAFCSEIKQSEREACILPAHNLRFLLAFMVWPLGVFTSLLILHGGL
jgi:hypothetical protein